MSNLPRNHAVRRSVVDSVMKPHRTRGESKYMLEEIYFSDLCGDIENKDENGEVIGINPQKAWFDNGKYRFQFPSLWYQSTCNNKAVGLRSIDLSPDAVSFGLDVIFYERATAESSYASIGTITLISQYSPYTDIMEIISDVALRLKGSINERDSLKNKGIGVFWGYNYRDSSAMFEVSSVIYPGDPDRFLIEFEVRDDFEFSNPECGFFECFNTTADFLAGKRRIYEFKNVWNRQWLFVHASFVNGTSFQFLGKNGEFYPKPSKMYRFNGNSPDFYFELSYDGIHPLQHRFARFAVQLTYIYNDADYMAE